MAKTWSCFSKRSIREPTQQESENLTGFRSWIPAWQFARTGTIKGLEQTLSALKDLDHWMRQAFVLGKNARLKDKRVIDVLREGDVSSVARAASAFGEHGAS